jgi:hypothetical protein
MEKKGRILHQEQLDVVEGEKVTPRVPREKSSKILLFQQASDRAEDVLQRSIQEPRVESHRSPEDAVQMKIPVTLEELKRKMVEASQEVVQTEEIVDSMRIELVKLMKQHILQRESNKNVQNSSKTVEDAENVQSEVSGQSIEQQITWMKDEIQVMEELCKELQKAFENRRIAYERHVAIEKMDRSRKLQVEQQTPESASVVQVGSSHHLVQKEARRV